MIDYLENRKSLKKKKKVEHQNNNNDDLADITLNRKRSDTFSIDEEQVPNEITNNSRVNDMSEYYFEDNSIMFQERPLGEISQSPFTIQKTRPQMFGNQSESKRDQIMS